MIFVGTEVKCPVGETSDNEGFTPGCECTYNVNVCSNKFKFIIFHNCNEQCVIMCKRTIFIHSKYLKKNQRYQAYTCVGQTCPVYRKKIICARIKK